MQVWQSVSKLDGNMDATTPTSASIIHNRRSSLAISALLNDVSIEPMQHPLAPNTATQLPWHHGVKCRLPNSLPMPPPSPMDYSPISSGSSSPSGSLDSFSRQPSITEPPDLWSHSRTGMHQTNNGIIVSSLAKAKRKRILPHQYKRLMEIFEKTDTPSSEIRSQLANELDMTKREVQVWFQNRRAKISRSRVNSLSTTSQQEHHQHQQTVRHHSLTLSSTNASTHSASPRRRASEYSHPYSKHIAPKKSMSTEPNYNHINSNTNPNHNDNSTNPPEQHASTLVLEAPYHPPQSPTITSAIDILASAAEMMRS
ncbi:Chitin synthase, class 7 [Mucor velutinosus]|uniref:Chitin synthase, class 7 n=1 Tax=Mucor velutinosus TaxID=708070 RepID=A0AAN7HZK4_9FUNG|nr:Chitin synthase, class 7 [Mucor velutinosus]